MSDKQNGELKMRARLAKQRLKMGYFDKRTAAMSETAAVRSVKRVPPQKTSSADEKLYRKVCAILDSDETVINPIGRLIEGEVYDKLDPASKQRYILELSNKFGELKERYYKERTGA